MDIAKVITLVIGVALAIAFGVALIPVARATLKGVPVALRKHRRVLSLASLLVVLVGAATVAVLSARERKLSALRNAATREGNARAWLSRRRDSTRACSDSAVLAQHRQQKTVDSLRVQTIYDREPQSAGDSAWLAWRRRSIDRQRLIAKLQHSDDRYARVLQDQWCEDFRTP